MSAAFLAFAVGLLAQVPAPTPSMSCARLCLAPVSTIGMDPDERAAVEAALVRALDAPRCAQPIVVDDVCFGDDACVKKAAAQDFIVVRAVRAGSELSLSWVAKKADAVTRGTHVAAAIPFYASGTLDHDVAAGRCTTTTTPPTSTTTSAATPTTTPPAASASSTLPSPPLIAVAAGATVLATSLLVFTVAAIGLESADTDGATKEIAFTAGWVAMGGVVVGAGVGAYGLYTLE